jgi:hypothetical protein
MSLSDLLDDTCKDKEFSEKLFKDIVKEDFLVDEEEVEDNTLRIAEFFKRDTLVNFTDTHLFKDLPNLINNYGNFYLMQSLTSSQMTLTTPTSISLTTKFQRQTAS